MSNGNLTIGELAVSPPNLAALARTILDDGEGDTHQLGDVLLCELFRRGLIGHITVRNGILRDPKNGCVVFYHEGTYYIIDRNGELAVKEELS